MPVQAGPKWSRGLISLHFSARALCTPASGHLPCLRNHILWQRGEHNNVAHETNKSIHRCEMIKYLRPLNRSMSADRLVVPFFIHSVCWRERLFPVFLYRRGSGTNVGKRFAICKARLPLKEAKDGQKKLFRSASSSSFFSSFLTIISILQTSSRSIFEVEKDKTIKAYIYMGVLKKEHDTPVSTNNSFVHACSIAMWFVRLFIDPLYFTRIRKTLQETVTRCRCFLALNPPFFFLARHNIYALARLCVAAV